MTWKAKFSLVKAIDLPINLFYLARMGVYAKDRDAVFHIEHEPFPGR
jgi:hypothetical protein